MKLAFDIFKLPEKYTFNQESLTDGKYIDDNSLFVLFCISKGLFSDKDIASHSFIFLTPFEWTGVDFTAFLIATCNNYNFKIKDIETYIGAVEDEYEVSYEPRKYKGAYKWILELQDKKPGREESILFDKFLSDKASASDLERALIYADRSAPQYKEAQKSDICLSKDLFRTILDYTHFSIIQDKPSLKRLNSDIKLYLKNFTQDRLVRNTKTKKVYETSVIQADNIFTFKKHSSLFKDYLAKMYEDYGTTVRIENIFEDKYSNLNDDIIRKRYSQRNFLFIHILLAFAEQGLLKILLLSNNYDIHKDEELSYQAQIEILPKFINENLDNKLRFDADKSRFYIQNKEIKVTKFKDEYHTLRVMFKNLKELPKEWFFSEIAELVDESNINDKKYYNAIYQLRIKLEKQGIKDFFMTTKQSVKINKKYLS